MNVKLTDQNLRTYGGFQWEIGKLVKTSGKGELCSSGWLHYYNSPLLAMFLNPIHANFQNPRLWEFKAEGKTKEDRGLKFGCTQGTIVRELEIPKITQVHRVAFAILCAKTVHKNEFWNKWADSWLSGINRTPTAATAAYAASAAYDTTAATAAYAACAAYDAYVAYDAAYAAYAARAPNLISLAEKAITYV